MIFDLPNTDEEFVMEAVAYSNALVMVANGLPQEMNRVASQNKSFAEGGDARRQRLCM